MSASRWHLLWAIPWAIVSTLVVEIVAFMPLYLLGLLVVPLASRYAPRTQRPSRIDPARMIETWANPVLDELWGNHEDGIRFETWDVWAWYLRNPVCNMRFWPVVSTLPGPGTRFVGSPEIAPGCRFVAWRGPYAGFRWEGKRWGVWFGFKVNPRDSRFVPDNDYRRWGLGTACQLLRFSPQSATAQPPSRLQT